MQFFQPVFIFSSFAGLQLLDVKEIEWKKRGKELDVSRSKTALCLSCSPFYLSNVVCSEFGAFLG